MMKTAPVAGDGSRLFQINQVNVVTLLRLSLSDRLHALRKYLQEP